MIINVTSFFSLQIGVTEFGHCPEESLIDHAVVMKGVGIAKSHCRFNNQDGVVTLIPLQEGQSFLNGK